MMDQAGSKQRPFLVIGTYDSCHPNHVIHGSNLKHQSRGQHRSEDEEPSSAPNSERIEQSTDLFTYCRAAQFQFNPFRKNSHQTTNSQRNELAARLKMRAKPNLNQIKGPTGSVRGHKDVVRKSLENIRAVASIASRRNFNSTSFQSFQSANSNNTSLAPPHQRPDGYNSLACSSLMMQMDEQHKAEYLERLLEDELGQCVAYTTTLGVIRRTFEDCKLLRSILSSNLIRYEERDIYLNQEYKKQLRLRCDTIQVPVLFVDGKYFGDNFPPKAIKEVEIMNEDGDLAVQLARFKMSEAPKHVCFCCGNAKFIACQSCNGSRKSAVHHFKYNSIALRCIRCDRNDGLVNCPVCSLPDGLQLADAESSISDGPKTKQDSNNNDG